ncbi:hypothetical protein [Brockia lithotrophica]|uniref:hypothetical protein n=1 Tax=Brockia lithotrophica TaxID=933949 RepID=UPI001B885093|nr:hypothetical protein [Brockia lithotrophica]
MEEIHETEGLSTNAIEFHRELNRLKKTDFPWMYEVSKWAAQEALRDLEKVFRNFFRGLKARRKVGYPKFRRKHDRRDSFRLDNSSGTIRLLLDGNDRRHPGKARHIVLPRIGAVRLKEKPIHSPEERRRKDLLSEGPHPSRHRKPRSRPLVCEPHNRRRDFRSPSTERICHRDRRQFGKLHYTSRRIGSHPKGPSTKASSSPHLSA